MSLDVEVDSDGAIFFQANIGSFWFTHISVSKFEDFFGYTDIHLSLGKAFGKMWSFG